MLRQPLVMIIAIVLTMIGNINPAIAQPSGHTSHHLSKPFGREFVIFAKEMDASMKKMMSDMHHPRMIGNVDTHFLTMMIPHHENAVEMARLVLLYGKDPLVRNLAEEIIASQQVEILAMHERLLVLQQGEDPDPDNFPALTGVRGTTMFRSQNE